MRKKIKKYFISKFDVNGSYTGNLKNAEEKPVQDADDL